MTIKIADIGLITLDTLNSIVSDEVPESHTLDFKEKVEDTSKLCILLSAFANTNGGCVIIGLSEGEHGVAKELCGIDDDLNQLLQRIERSVANNIQPRIILRHQPIKLADGRNALVLGVPPSRSGPHMYIKGDSRRFYTRLSRSNEQMDLDQIKRGFLSNQSEQEMAIEQHEYELLRLRQLDPDKYSFMLTCHLPAGYGEIFDPSDEHLCQELLKAAPVLSSGKGMYPTFHGINLTRRNSNDLQSFSRSGTYAIADTFDSRPYQNGKYDISAYTARQDLYSWITRVHRIYDAIQYQGQLFACLTIDNCKDKLLRVSNYGYEIYDLGNATGRMTMPVVTLDMQIADWRPYINIWLERLWNSAGFHESVDTDETVPLPFAEDQD